MNEYLNIENIERSTHDIEWHPLYPFVPDNAQILFLGSFPPQRKRWCMNFFYPNFINDHWRIEGEIWFGDKSHFVDDKKFDYYKIIEFCKDKGLAFYDTATAVHRLQDNASDKFLEVVVPTDIPELLKKMPSLKAIVTTGDKATQTICDALGINTPPKVNQFVNIPQNKHINSKNLILYRLPSSSRAYPLAFSKKADAYKKMFEATGCY